MEVPRTQHDDPGTRAQASLLGNLWTTHKEITAAVGRYGVKAVVDKRIFREILFGPSIIQRTINLLADIGFENNTATDPFGHSPHFSSKKHKNID